MEYSRMIDNDLSRYKMGSDRSRYSGPEPQTLPLPPELVMRNLSYLEQARDKQNARLVCKGFAAAGLSSLTSTAYFSTSLIQLGRPSEVPRFSSPTLEIAMHPVVSKYITQMVCDGTQLPTPYPHFRSFQNWWATLGKNQISRPVQDIHMMYASRYRQDKSLIGKGEDRKIFRAALQHFVHLRSIVFTDVAADEQSRDFPRPQWPSAVPEGDLWGPSSPYHSFAMCIRSLSEMAIKLQELSIGGRCNAISDAIFSSASCRDYSHLINVFKHLRNISVSVNPYQDTGPLNFAHLGRLLIHAKSAQSLNLKCTGVGRRQSRLVLSRVFQDATWPHLKHFGLQGFSMCTDSELIAFFERHRATIDSVALKSMFLHEKDQDSEDHSPCEAWKHFFGELRKRSIKFQHLELCQIHDCCNWEGELPDLAALGYGGEKVVQYLHDGGRNPLSSEKIPENIAQG